MKSIVALALLAALPVFAQGEQPVVGGLDREGTEKFTGAVLVSELSCTACHTTDLPAFAAKAGPDLSSIGSRAHGAHLQKFLANPASVKPGTTMPDVLGHLPQAQREDAATALAHYLATLGTPSPSNRPAPDAVERGHALYHSVGCVACHSPEKAVPGSVPLGPLAEKYSLASLTAFLKDPLAARPSGRMPDSHLEHPEAEDIASYLLREQKTPLEPFRADAALAARGKALFTEHRCHACHSTGEKTAPPSLAPLAKLRTTEGCLSGKRGAWPHYPLSPEQKTAMTAAIGESGKTWTPAEQAQLPLVRLNCIACHTRDGLGGVSTDRNPYFTGREESLGEQGRIPPPLTGVGAKLKAKWMREVIANGAGVRTTMNTRMPKFGAAHADPLVAQLKALDTLPTMPFERVPESAKPQNVGRELAGAKGLNCIACHAFRGRTAAIRGPELTTMAERLEENWFHQFLAQPQRFAPLTVMPNFWPDGKSPLPDVLGGDPGQQRDALWRYFAQGPEAREPQGLVLEPLVVEVKDEAVIIRRAFPGIGKRGIGIGYPGGIHVAFDAAQMRLGSIWSGSYIEASPLWRGQGSGQAQILGKDVVNLPPGPAFAVLGTSETAWPALDSTPRKSPNSFHGYTLDAERRPTLRYSIEGLTVEDYFHERRDAAGKLFLERSLKFPAPVPPGLHLRVAVDKSITARGADEFLVGKKLLVRVPGKPRVRSAGESQELLLPVSGEVKLEYHLISNP
jgi:mono/diheme cytochrome c family protein